jgi:hypothetical protein
MPLNSLEEAALDCVRRLERARLEAIRTNDADTMATILDEKFIYVNYRGTIYNKTIYLNAVRCHELTYESDVDITESHVRVDESLVILVGQMRGHARLGGEQDVYRHTNMRVWRKRGQEWKLLAWQSTAPW